jgi:hypothetical protein
MASGQKSPTLPGIPRETAAARRRGDARHDSVFAESRATASAMTNFAKYRCEIMDTPHWENTANAADGIGRQGGASRSRV